MFGPFAAPPGEPPSAARRPWAAADVELVRAEYRRTPAADIARRVGRPITQVYQKARSIGLSIPQRFKEPGFVAYVTEKNGQGWSDSEIAASRGVDRHALSHMRRCLGLPDNSRGPRWREKIRAAMIDQCYRWGVPNLGSLRAKVLLGRSAAAGWPADLPWRAGQILSLLWERGPMTRRQIVEAIRPDLVGRCTRKAMNKALADNDVWHGRRQPNSYLATLMRRGLLIDLGRIVGGRGKGRNIHLYSLPLAIERRQVQ